MSGNEGDSGGGIATNNVSATLTNIVVRDNLAKYYGGGIQARFTNVTLSDSTVSNNSVGYGIYGFGGGIYARGSNIDITNSTISGNSAYVRGGGVDIWSHNSFSSSLMLLKSTVSGNLSKNGGGIHAMAYNSTTSPSTISLSNSTISGNSATDNGGGVYANYSTVTSTNSTISGNRAGISGGGIYTSVSSYVYLNNSIVSGNRLAPGQVAGFEIHDSGLSSTFTTNDANLFGDNSKPNSYAFTGFSPGASDIDATSDKDNIPLSSILDSLGNNGGPTRTLGLKKDSPAIDAGNNGICPATDQRGELRDDGLCDIGAFEGFVNDGSCYVIRDTNSKTIVFCL